jgi:hypothetical protein
VFAKSSECLCRWYPFVSFRAIRLGDQLRDRHQFPPKKRMCGDCGMTLPANLVNQFRVTLCGWRLNTLSGQNVSWRLSLISTQVVGCVISGRGYVWLGGTRWAQFVDRSRLETLQDLKLVKNWGALRDPVVLGSLSAGCSTFCMEILEVRRMILEGKHHPGPPASVSLCQ